LKLAKVGTKGWDEGGALAVNFAKHNIDGTDDRNEIGNVSTYRKDFQ